MNDGIRAEFFGHPAMTASALAALALKLGCPVLPAYAQRLAPGRFRVTYEAPLPLPDTRRPGRRHRRADPDRQRSARGVDQGQAGELALAAPALAEGDLRRRALSAAPVPGTGRPDPPASASQRPRSVMKPVSSRDGRDVEGRVGGRAAGRDDADGGDGAVEAAAADGRDLGGVALLDRDGRRRPTRSSRSCSRARRPRTARRCRARRAP